MLRARATAVAVASAIAVVAVAFAVGLRATRHSSQASASRAFSWLQPASPPPDWKIASSTAGALAYPPGWTPIKTDPGSASVARLSSDGAINAFLNATPLQGDETLANWTQFRPAHNKNEGNRDVHVLASSTNVNFRSGPGSCVIDDYTTSKARYREIACFVSGASSSVIVAAAPTALWDDQAPTLERAVSSFVP